MSRAKSERPATVLIGASQAQPPSRSASAADAGRTKGRPLVCEFTSFRKYRTEPTSASGELLREREQRVQEDVGAALDRRRVARLVHAVALPALRRDEDHPGVRDRREVLRVVPRRGVEARGGQAERVARALGGRLDALGRS